MNYLKSKIIYLSVIIVSLVIIGYSLYHFYGMMGGFKETRVIKMGPINRKVAGIHYQGSIRSNEYEKIRKTCEDQITEDKLNGYFTEITFFSDTLEKNEIDQFIGITLNSGMSEIPYDFEVKEFSSGMRYVIPLGVHPLVLKPAYKYEEMITEQADKDGVILRPFFMAVHYRKDSMSVEGWVANP